MEQRKPYCIFKSLKIKVDLVRIAHEHHLKNQNSHFKQNKRMLTGLFYTELTFISFN